MSISSKPYFRARRVFHLTSISKFMEVAFLLNREEEWESKILITINLEMKNTWFHQHHGLKMQRTTRIISIEGKIQSPTCTISASQQNLQAYN